MRRQIVVSPSEDDSFVVRVIDRTGATEHHVTVPEELRDRQTPTADLIRASVRFLLSHKPKEDIRDRLDLGRLRSRFPDYAEKVLARMP